MAYYFHAKFHWNRTCALGNSMGRGPLLSPTSGSNKGSKNPGQIELNMCFTYTKMSINCFSRYQLPPLISLQRDILTNLFLPYVSAKWLNLHSVKNIWFTVIASSLDSFNKVSKWTSPSEFFNKPLKGKFFYGKFLKKHFCWNLLNISWVFESNFCFSGKWFPFFNSVIVVKIFSVLRVSFKMFFRTLRAIHSSNLPRMKHDTSMKIQYPVNIM